MNPRATLPRGELPPTHVSDVEPFEYGGARLIDEVRGESLSPHIVFLHGWGGTRDSLRAIAALFEHTHRVHLIDLPGFGAASPPPPHWGTVEYADLVQQYLAARIDSPVTLVGHSFGGRVSVRLGARRLPQIERIVLMGVPGVPVPGWSRAKARRSAIRALRRVLVSLRPITGQRLLDWHTRRFGSKDYLAAGDLRPILVRTVNEDLSESAATINCPVLLLWGSDDTEAPLSMAHRYKALLGDHATLNVLPHKDHYPYQGTGAHLCAYKIRSWLEAHADA